MDDLTYSYIYNGNQVDQIEDAGNKSYGFIDADYDSEYTYDANGNMIMDMNKGIISITYNHLNLPEVIKFEDNLRIEYLYNANGVKLQKRYYVNNLLNTTTDYSGEFVYTNRSIDYISIAEGRLKKGTNGTYTPEFFLKDHLGNVRVVLSSPTTVTQVTDYYPFGMEIPVSGSVSLYSNQLKYNSKELQTEADLQWYDYGARFYDPQIGRWHVPDAYAEKYFNLSPYQYGGNNPIRFIDINGDSLSATENFINNNRLAEVMKAILATKWGYEYFAQYAAEGDELFGYKFDSNGEYSDEGIDLIFDAARLDIDSGNTDCKESKDDNGYDIRITIDNTTNASIFELAGTIIHEGFLEASYMAKDIFHDNKFDYSNISDIVKNSTKGATYKY
ncbi:MAG: RHS repeat-associated core domain-containing protein, partial [Bacteroidales bacterium]|nr:RHS repeat-associated core domain-containing protein [Bacteroidales bacterium]